MRAQRPHSLAFLVIVGLLPARLPAADQACVKCIFDVSAVVADAEQAKSLEKRLCTRLLPELRGTDQGKAKLRLAAAFTRGRLVCRAFLAYGDGKENQIDEAGVGSLEELAGIANRLAASEKLWMGEPAGPIDREKCSVRALMPRAPAPRWLTGLSQGGVWKTDRPPPAGTGGLIAARKLRGPDPIPNELLIPLAIQQATIDLTVLNAENVPLSDIAVYVQAGDFPSVDPIWLDEHKPLGTTKVGKLRFEWKDAGPAFLLAVRDGVALVRFVVAPTEALFHDKIVFPAKWDLDGKEVSLDAYVRAKQVQIVQMKESHHKKMDVLKRVEEAIRASDFDKALKTVAELPADDEQRMRTEKEIGKAKKKAGFEIAMHKYALARKVKDHDSARMYLQEADSLAEGEKKPELAAELTRLNAEARKFLDETKDQRKLLLSDLPNMTVREISDRTSEIEEAVRTLCEWSQLSSLNQAVAELEKADDLLHGAMKERLAEIKAGRAPTDDPEYSGLSRTRERLLDLRKQIANALKGIKPAPVTPAPAASSKPAAPLR